MEEARLVEELRPGALALAYRMLGSVSEAEDVVQEGLLRLHRALRAGEEIAAPRAYLATVVTRLAIDALRSARARREAYPGEWLPEPIVGPGPHDPSARAEAADALSLAVLVLLETLSPEQRAAFVLREAFGYPYAEIAALLGTSEANARQLTARARRHVAGGRPRFEASRQRRDELAARFVAAAREGDLEGLERVLAADVALHGDGGGRVPALARPVRGRARVARTLAAWIRAATRLGGATLERAEVNGQPGVLVRDARGGLAAVWGLDVAGGRVRAVRAVVNPEKLAHLGPLADPTPWRGQEG